MSFQKFANFISVWKVFKQSTYWSNFCSFRAWHIFFLWWNTFFNKNILVQKNIQVCTTYHVPAWYRKVLNACKQVHVWLRLWFSQSIYICNVEGGSQWGKNSFKNCIVVFDSGTQDAVLGIWLLFLHYNSFVAASCKRLEDWKISSKWLWPHS